MNTRVPAGPPLHCHFRCLASLSAAAGTLLAARIALASCPLPDAGGSGTFTPPIPPTLTSFFNSSNKTEYVIYVDTNGYLWSLSYNQNTSGPWTTTQITNGTAPPVFSAGSALLGFVDNTGQDRIFFNELAFGGDDAYSDVVELKGNPPAASSWVDLTTLTSSASYVIHPSTYPFTGQTPGSGCAFFKNAGGTSLEWSVAFGTPLVGFLDSTGTYHVFYQGWYSTYNGTSGYAPDPYVQLFELYGTGSGDSWTNHQLTVAPAYAGVSGMAALWDGSVEHIYYNSKPGELDETYFTGGNWFNHAIPTTIATPYYNLTAASPDGNEWIWGIGWSSTGPANDGAQYDYHSGTWSETTVGLTNFAANSGTTSFVWEDNTAGLNSSGTDGGLFYIGTDNNVYEWLPTLGTANLDRAATSNRQYSPVSNQITGFYDGGATKTGSLHLFFVNSSGSIVELYASASTVGPSLPSWQYHTIGSGGAAH